MSADLREKLEALADEMEAAATRNLGIDVLPAPEPRRIRGWADRIRDLLASHEEREGEGEGDGWKDAAVQVGAEAYDHRGRLERIAEAMWPEDVAENGYPSMEAVAREAVRRLRSHTDREPDRPPGHYVCWCGKVVHGGPGKYGGRTLYETNGDLHECVYIGPPVQPEEAEDA